MSDDFTPTLFEQTQCLPRDIYGDQVRKAPQRDDSALRASRAELYANRLNNGLDIWTGESLDDAREETTRMLGLRSQPKRGERQPKTRNRLVKAV